MNHIIPIANVWAIFGHTPTSDIFFAQRSAKLLGHRTDSDSSFLKLAQQFCNCITSGRTKSRHQIEHFWWFWTSQFWRQSSADGTEDHSIHIPHKRNQISSATKVNQHRKRVSQSIFGGLQTVQNPMLMASHCLKHMVPLTLKPYIKH